MVGPNPNLKLTLNLINLTLIIIINCNRSLRTRLYNIFIMFHIIISKHTYYIVIDGDRPLYVIEVSGILWLVAPSGDQ